MTEKLSKTPFVITGKNIHRVMGLHPKQVIHAYKVARKDGKPAVQIYYKGRIRYKLGKVTAQRRCDTDRLVGCGVGLHVATKAWCQDWWSSKIGRRDKDIFIVRFLREDVGVVPYRDYPWAYVKHAYEGKFRVRRMLVWKRTTWR